MVLVIEQIVFTVLGPGMHIFFWLGGGCAVGCDRRQEALQGRVAPNRPLSIGSIPCRCCDDGFGFTHNYDFPNQSCGKPCCDQSGEAKPPTPELLERPDSSYGDECYESDSMG